jgi:hypothetical protein
VSVLEWDLKSHRELLAIFPHSKNVMKITVNVSLTLSVFTCDGFASVEGLVTFLAPFLTSFVIDADGHVATHPNGEPALAEEVEVDIFVCFSSFYDHNQLGGLVRPSRHPFLKELFLAVGSRLDQHFPDSQQLLYQKHAYSLDFLSDDCSKWFTPCFEPDAIKSLWISILSLTIACQFFQCFPSSMLFSLAPLFLEINPLNCGNS